MNKKSRIISLITEIRNSHSEMENIFMEGSCMNLFCILRVVYPEAVAYYDCNHIITKIDDSFYDITGEVQKGKHIPFTEVYVESRTPKAFKEMYNAQYEIK